MSKYFLALILSLVAIPAFASNTPITKPDSKSQPILIGQSARLSGGQAQYSADVVAGIEAYFQKVNKNRGVNWQQLKLITEDDQGKKENSLTVKTLAK